MKTADKKLKEALLEVILTDEKHLEEEMSNTEKHIFSNEFIEKMAKLDIVENN